MRVGARGRAVDRLGAFSRVVGLSRVAGAGSLALALRFRRWAGRAVRGRW